MFLLKRNKPGLMNPDNHLVQNISITMLKYIFYGSPSVHQLSFVFINDNLILKCH